MGQLKRLENLEGKKFGKLLVLKFSGVKSNNTLWLCMCECGNETTAFSGNLKRGHTKSCGCLRIARESLFKRFWNKVLIGDGCWEWIGARQKDWHGRVSVWNEDGTMHNEVTSRAAWFLTTGKWPELQVLHRCDNPVCVRPSHLFEGTQQDNIQDCIDKGRFHGGKIYATVCKRGHDLTDAYMHQGKRHCRICRRDWKRERRKLAIK